jgi:cytochrome c553
VKSCRALSSGIFHSRRKADCGYNGRPYAGQRGVHPEALIHMSSFIFTPRFLRSLLMGAAALILLPAAAQTINTDTMEERVAACTACHGREGRAAADGYYPRIAGKPAGYLYNQLINFREGRRQWPLMIYMVDHLSDAYLLEMSHYFAQIKLPYPPPQQVDVPPSVMERGRQLVVSGEPSKGVPACASCHGAKLTGMEPAIPGLLGLPRDYLNAQFGAWKNGTRKAVAPDCMAEIAERLSVEDISAASAWLASQPVPEEYVALPAADGKLPMECGNALQEVKR